MKVGILGAGEVGQSFARAILKLGHEVMLSSRTPASEKMQQLRSELGSGAQIGTVTETIAYGEVLAVALRWGAVPDVVAQGDWSGKTVIDMTNRSGGRGDISAAEELAKVLPDAHIVKAFNTIGAEHYTDPTFGNQAATMFIAGDHAQAKQTVQRLTEAMGFDVVDAGDLSAAVHLESLAALWIHLALRAGHGRGIAFRLVSK